MSPKAVMVWRQRLNRSAMNSNTDANTESSVRAKPNSSAHVSPSAHSEPGFSVCKEEVPDLVKQQHREPTGTVHTKNTEEQETTKKKEKRSHTRRMERSDQTRQDLLTVHKHHSLRTSTPHNG